MDAVVAAFDDDALARIILAKVLEGACGRRAIPSQNSILNLIAGQFKIPQTICNLPWAGKRLKCTVRHVHVGTMQPSGSKKIHFSTGVKLRPFTKEVGS